jgi:hypothetical protein
MQKVGTQMSRKQKSLQRKQITLSTNALGDETAIYARVTKHQGNRSFLITIFDQKNNRHLTDVKARVPSKRAPKITIPSVVNVALAEDDDPADKHPEQSWASKTWEILTPLDEKSVKQLKKDGRISEIIASNAEISSDTIKNVDSLKKKGLGSSAMDDLDFGIEFEREGDDEEVETNTDKRDKVSKHKERVLRTEDDEVDIDAI